MNGYEDSLAPRTRFDLSFRLGDIPVRVHPYFWLSTVLLGLNLKLPGIDMLIYLLVWAALLFVSILVHELGHILMGRYFGKRGHIVLTGFCGLAIGSSDLPERWQRNAVSLAGPGAGFLLAALVAGLVALYSPALSLSLLGAVFRIIVPLGPDAVPLPDVVWYALSSMLWINIFWGLVNLLPIWPLDGGQISREACQQARGREGVRLSLMISLGVAAGFAVFALIEWIRREPLVPYLSLGGSLFPVLFFALLAVSSWQLLRFIRLAGSDWEQSEPEPLQPWERDADWWKQGNNPWRD